MTDRQLRPASPRLFSPLLILLALGLVGCGGEAAEPEPSGAPSLDPSTPTYMELSGHEPFWNVRVEGDEAEFRSPEFLDGVEYYDVQWTATEGGWQLEALRDFIDGIEYLAAELISEPCQDTMTGVLYPFQVTVRWRGAILEGCAQDTPILPESEGF
jgi:uncharacterized membrane protein